MNVKRRSAVSPNRFMVSLAALLIIILSVRSSLQETDSSFGEAIKQGAAREFGQDLLRSYVPVIAFAQQGERERSRVAEKQLAELMPLYGYVKEVADTEGSETEALRGASTEELPTEKLSAEEASLEELLRQENHAALSRLAAEEEARLQQEGALQEGVLQDGMQTEGVPLTPDFVPHEIQNAVDLQALNSYEKLVGAFYTIDGNTMAGSDQLNVESLLGKDLRISKEEEGPQILIYHTHSQESFADSVQEGALQEGVLQDGMQTEGVPLTPDFVPHEIQNAVDLQALNSYEKLVGAFYTIDGNTMAGSDQLNVESLLGKDLRISKEEEGPQILIYHTHSQESFADSVPGEASTTIMGVGDRLSEILTNRYGYQVLHHMGQYDVDSRDDAYAKSLPDIERVLAENPSIQVVIDLHRDSMPEETKLVMDLDGRPTARFMFFNGLSRTKKTGNISYLYNEYQEDNLAFSFQMQLKAMECYPGLTRKIYLKGYRYNMHLRPRTTLIELGAQNNTLEEALNACEPLAHILDMVLSGT